jgi:hemoglobin
VTTTRDPAPGPPAALAGVANLYDRLGGDDAMAAIVVEFYDRVRADESLAPFFAHAPMDRLRRMQREFLAASLGGPTRYSGGELSVVHGKMAIKPQHFSRFVAHFLDTLVDRGTDEDVIEAVVDALWLYADTVVGGYGEDG